MSGNPLKALSALGQSIWLDYIDREILVDGTLDRLIQEDGVSGLTSNPAIFQKAIARGGAYRDDIERLRAAGADRETLYERLVLADIGQAADAFRALYEATEGRDGYVSIEVSPLLARDTEATITEARELWQRLDRPNIMIKVPGTREGIPAIRRLLAEGINVNVTLLFSVGRYLDCLDAYERALEDRRIAGLPLAPVASVASFFLSRIDVKVDALLDAIIAGDDPHRAARARELRGQTAIACAAFAYRRFRERCHTGRWQALATAGARVQRLLWASTGTKDPSYSDIKYVEPLIAPDTVNTLPPKTLDAYRDHGDPAVRIDAAIEAAPAVLHGLVELGINLHEIDDQLEEEGIRKFVDPYQSLLETLAGMAD
ncbi:transaldolase [Thiohalobacter sp.]|uniref:transaldolase n=1 Tax=Thiohalobacter sp. TaxID=2025948 RepID=UPI00262A5263|nr:transaldolase [Thiohalobacter sp.]